MKSIKPIIFILIVFFALASCKKGDIAQSTLPLDSATIMGFKDSTQLVKSVHMEYFDSSGTSIQDSATMYYYYDTVKRAITITIKGFSTSTQDYGGTGVLNYNSAGLLTGWNTLSHLVPPSSGDMVSVNYAYDASNVLSSATISLYGGQSYVVNMVKTILPSGGYQLRWMDSSPDRIADSVYYMVNFDANGRSVSYYNINSSDSLVYDASGNISKVIETFYTSPYNLAGANSFVLYDFSSRDTKGDQLYKLNRILYNGVADIPSEISNFGNQEMSGEYIYQYSKYPALVTHINLPGDGSYCAGCAVSLQSYSSSPQYDSKGRLLKYRMFQNDGVLFSIDYSVQYYK